MEAETIDANPSGSLEDTETRINSLLSKTEEKEKGETQPEPPKSEKTEDKQVPSETDEETPSIEAASEEEPAAEPDQPRVYKVKVDGVDLEVTEDELTKGYSRTQDYTRKTQELAKARKEFEDRELAAVRAERQEIQQLLEKLKPIVKPPEPDWATLKIQLEPTAYAERLDAWRVQQSEYQAVEAAQADLKARQDEDAKKGFEKYVAEEQEKLLEKLPFLISSTRRKVRRCGTTLLNTPSRRALATRSSAWSRTTG
jgi:hypothetical protein